jgi:hypothetical protein
MKNHIYFFALLFTSCFFNPYEKTVKGNYKLKKREYWAIKDSALIEGFVFDIDSKKMIVSGLVYIKDTKIGTMTDSTGYFKLVLPPNKYIFVATSIGCTELITKKIFLQKNEKRTLIFRLGTYIIYD